MVEYQSDGGGERADWWINKRALIGWRSIGDRLLAIVWTPAGQPWLEVVSALAEKAADWSSIDDF